ncbi:putative trypsin-6 isoform X1 [Drosophila sechellia]|uniref:GM25124 n=2 Tax=Drosophila sechellia TaxID=7238 RepID=B4HKM0_DROSE|nr:putative trypsin-6 isoform X1 [Drosophila sechellia]EDW40823.1 GM25124 [Drosophila sechellia]
MSSQNFLVLLVISFFLPYNCLGDSPRNAFSSLNRVKRLSDGDFDDDSIALSNYCVSLRSRAADKFFGDNHFCSGVILAPMFVMTSAHCLINKRRVLISSRVLLIVAATLNRLKYIPNRTFVTPVAHIWLPESFTMRNKQDFGLLKVKNPFPRNNEHISIARLPVHPPLPGLKCKVMGWGRMYKGGPLASYMLYIDVEVMDSKLCAKLLRVPSVEYVCALDIDDLTAQQPCGGDWGAPMMHNGTVYGIVTVLAGCGVSHLPSLYTNVHSNVNWIHEKIISSAGSILLVPALFRYLSIVLIYVVPLFSFVIKYNSVL